jgi:hypothetical protein
MMLRKRLVHHQSPYRGRLEDTFSEASATAPSIHFFAGRAGTPKYSLHSSESCRSAFWSYYAERSRDTSVQR